MVYELIKALEEMKKYNNSQEHKEAMTIVEKIKVQETKVQETYTR